MPKRGGYGAGKKKIGPANKRLFKATKQNVDVAQSVEIVKLKRKVAHQAPEPKQLGLFRASAAVGVAGSVINISNIAQGDANGQRDGLWITPTSVELRCTAVDTTSGLTAMRFLVIRWMDNTTNPPLVPSVLLNQTGGANPDFNSIYNYIYRDKFNVLYDKTLAFDQYLVVAGSSTTATMKNFKVSLPLKQKLKYIDDVATNYEKGNLFVIAIASSATATLQFDGVLRYID